MSLADRLRRALDESALSDVIRLAGDDRGVPFAG